MANALAAAAEFRAGAAAVRRSCDAVALQVDGVRSQVRAWRCLTAFKYRKNRYHGNRIMGCFISPILSSICRNKNHIHEGALHGSVERRGRRVLSGGRHFSCKQSVSGP